MAQDAGQRFEELLAELRSEHLELRRQLDRLSPMAPPPVWRAAQEPKTEPTKSPTCDLPDNPSSLPSVSQVTTPDAVPAEFAHDVRERLPGSVEEEGHDALRLAASMESTSTSRSIRRIEDSPAPLDPDNLAASEDSGIGTCKQADEDSQELVSATVFREPTSPTSAWARERFRRSAHSSQALQEWASDRVARTRTSITVMFSQPSELFPSHSEEKSTMLRDMVSTPQFELVWSMAIFANTFVMAAEAQYGGLQTAHDVGYDAHGLQGDVWASVEPIFEGFNWVFGVLFAIELIIRLVALRCELVMDPLSWIDITSVLFWTLERVFPNHVSFNTMMIRMARLVRLARFIRIVKFVNAFQKLYLLVQSIKSSFSALVWSSAVLCLGEFIIALVINISLADFLRDVDKSELDRLELFKYYGTFTGALLTQFEMLLGNWYTITRALVLHSELWALYGIIHQLILGFAVIEVITGVFLRETFQVASLDDGIMTTEEQRAVRMNTEKLKAFFESADIDGNGQLDELEIKEVLTRNKVQEWLSAMGLEVEEVEDAFHLFDVNGDGEISVEEFVGGALKLRGPARATEVQKLHRKVDKMFTCMGLSQTPENQKLAPPEEFE